MGLRKQSQLSAQRPLDRRMSTLTPTTHRVVPGAISHRLLCCCLANATTAADRIRRQRRRGLHARLHRIATRAGQGPNHAEQVDHRHAQERETEFECGEPAVYFTTNAWICSDDA
jgi:hypothetical protein